MLSGAHDNGDVSPPFSSSKDDEKLQRTKMTEGLGNADVGERLKHFQVDLKEKV